jgi:hypothetical protein
MNPNDAAYWVEDGNGNLMVYNGSGQYLDAVSKNAAGDFVARFNQGQRDMTKDYRPGADTGSGGGANGPAWANVNLRGQELNQSHQEFGQRLGEEQRQFDARMGQDNSQFNARLGLDQATQKWREAVDARDFDAAEYWKARAQELSQNRLALDYTSLLASKSGPQDWITYGRLSRQESPLGTPDGKTVPLDQALPEWARGFKPGSYPDSRGQTGASQFAGQGAVQIAPKPMATAGPQWTQAAPGWKQADGSVTAGTAQDLMKNTPATMQPGWFAGAGGTPIKMSDWMSKQVAPNA